MNPVKTIDQLLCLVRGVDKRLVDGVEIYGLFKLGDQTVSQRFSRNASTL